MNIDGADITFSGSASVDSFYLGSGAYSIDLTNTKASQDKIYLSGTWADFSSNISFNADTGVITLNSSINGKLQSLKVVNGFSATSSDVLIFKDGGINTFQLFNNINDGLSINALSPSISIGSSLSPIKSVSNNSIVKAVAIDGKGSTFMGLGNGPSLIVSGSSEIDSVYIKEGSNVDATNLKVIEALLIFKPRFAKTFPLTTEKSPSST